MNPLLLLTAVLLTTGLILLWLSRKKRRAAGLPAGRIIYSDTSPWAPVEKPLFDADLGLAGKPDYLVEKEGKFIPVEVKSSRVTSGPYDGHIFQLAAYCRLVETTFGKRPPYGILHYPNRTFAVDYTPQLEIALLDLLAAMRVCERQREIHRSHASPALCQRCGYRTICSEALVGDHS